MYMSAMKGKCLNMLHVWQDTLFMLGDTTTQMPVIPSEPSPTVVKPVEENDDLNAVEVAVDTSEATETTASDSKETAEASASEISNLISEMKVDKQEEQRVEEAAAVDVDHEKVLTDAFLIALKYKSKEIKLPCLVSTFMKTVQACW
jgi:hypothetical protein